MLFFCIIIYRANASSKQVITLMKLASGVLFQDFPDSFVLFGGATLLLFHQSSRHSGDLDLLSTTEEPPKPEAIQASLATGIRPTAEALNIGHSNSRTFQQATLARNFG